MDAVLLIISIILALIIIADTIQTRYLIAIGTQLAASAKRYEQSGTGPRILVIGDSTAVGTGASSPKASLAGLLGQAHPDASIENHGVNGAKVTELIPRLEALAGNRFDLVVLHIGGNDTVRFTDLKDLERDYSAVLVLAKALSPRVIHVSTGNIGTSKLIPWGVRWLYTRRTRKTRDLFQGISKEKGVLYVNLFREAAQDPFAQNPKVYYAADIFHPSDAGYADWFKRISPVVGDILSR